jgi:hypothetical protein
VEERRAYYFHYVTQIQGTIGQAGAFGTSLTVKRSQFFKKKSAAETFSRFVDGVFEMQDYSEGEARLSITKTN